MIRAVLVDDEENSVKNLQFLLTKYCPQVHIVAVTTIPEAAITLIQKHKPDVVFLDIEMPRFDGFQVLQ